MGFFGGLITLVLLKIIEKFKPSPRIHKKIVIVLTLAGMIIMIGIMKDLYNPSPHRAFKGIVCNPIPSSVKNIYYVKDYLVMDSVSRLRFEISNDDLEKIILSLGLIATDEVKDNMGLITHLKKVDWWAPHLIGQPQCYYARPDPEKEIDYTMWVDTNNGVVYLQRLEW